uniref:Uncharacterized protein n=1 Tax=Anguilla anguilla TaxID=7936 RepID=A0A0E9RWW2_ANGAN
MTDPPALLISNLISNEFPLEFRQPLWFLMVVLAL